MEVDQTLAKDLKIQDNKLTFFEDYEVISSKTDDPNFQITLDGKKLFLHSSYNPIREAERWASSLDPDCNYIVVGMGMGYHVEKLAESLQADRKILVIEPEPSIYNAMREVRDLTSLLASESLFLVEGLDWNTIALMVDYIVRDDLSNKIQIVYLPVIEKIYRSEIIQLQETVKKALEAQIVNRSTVLHFAQTWTENFFENLEDNILSPGVKGLFNRFQGKPVFVVAAGPSLDKNMHLLKEAKGKGVILCVGTALKGLLKAGIEPDFVVAYDGGEYNYKHFKDVESDVPLIFGPTIYPEILKTYQGSKIVMSLDVPFLNWFVNKLNIAQKGEVLTGPSSANVAFDIAYLMGGDPIVFVGQDLAFDDDGTTHSRSSIHMEWNTAKRAAHFKKTKDQNSNLIKVEGINGTPVYTTLSMKSFLLWFEKVIGFKAKDRQCIDATEGGAFIPGTKVLTLRDVIDTYCQRELPVTEIISEVLLKNKESKEELRSALMEVLEKILKQLKRIATLATRGSNYAEELHRLYRRNHLDVSQIRKLGQNLDKCDAQILEAKEAMTFTEMLLQPVIAQVLSKRGMGDPNESEQEKGLRVSWTSHLLYSEIKENCELMQKIIRNKLIEINK